MLQSLAQKLMDLADINGNKCMDYEEFVSATMHMCKLNQEEHLLAAFKVGRLACAPAPAR